MMKIRIKGSPDPIDTTPSKLKHKFKFDIDDLRTNVGQGTQAIVCI
jgi:hypothetical protein